jgi:hypothetical protein
MRKTCAVCAGALVILLAPAALAQHDSIRVAQASAPVRAAASAPYAAVAVSPAKPVADASLDGFRKELGDIANRKDRAALARLIVYRGFFWEGDDKSADPKKSAIDNLAAALGLDAKDGAGWQALAELAAEANAGPDPDRKRVFCAPASPSFDDQAFDDLLDKTQTDASEWGYPTSAGIEVREKPESGAPVVETLGLHAVRLLDDDAAGASRPDWARVATPAGKTGFVAAKAILPLDFDQICYIKEATGWRIAGIVGGGER